MARTDTGLTALNRVLRDYFRGVDPHAEITVKHGYRDNIHIRVVTPHFEGLTMPQRYDEVWPVLEHALAPDDFLRVSLCILITPEEYRASYAEPLAAA